MSTFFDRHRVLRALGPLLIALALLAALFLSPFAGVTKYDLEQLDSFARDPWSRANFIGYSVKQQTFSHPQYLPILGSSEMEHVDSFHPSVFFDKYKMGYTPYLVGQKGTQSLTLFFYLNSVANQLQNRKVVVVISPQWFTPTGIKPAALENFVSKGEVYNWLNTADADALASRQLANRLLTVPDFSDSYLIKNCLQSLAAGRALNPLQKAAVGASDLVWKKEDLLFSSALQTTTSNKNAKMVHRYARPLPDQPDPLAWERIAIEQGSRAANNNPYFISNGMWTKSGKTLLRQKGQMATLSYQKSPEYADFQQLLAQLAANNDQVLFVIQPVNGVYERELAGLPLSTFEKFSAKISHQLRSQGFTDILDLTDKYNELYYSGDTIHFGTRGWLATDRAIIDFMRRPLKTHYHLSNEKFLSLQWQQAESASAFERQWHG